MNRSAVRGFLVSCAIVVVLPVTGCGVDGSVRADVERYFRQVVVPIAESEIQVEKTSAELATVAPSSKELLGLYETKLLPLYQDILKRAQSYEAASEPVRSVNEKMVALYSQGVAELQNAVRSIKNRDDKGFERASRALAGLKPEPIHKELANLATTYQVSVELKSKTFQK